MKKNISKKGFTLVETMAVVAIIVTLSGVTMYSASVFISKAEAKAAEVYANGTAQEQARVDVKKTLMVESRDELNVHADTDGDGHDNGIISGATDTPTPTEAAATATPTATSTPEATPTPTATPMPTATPVPTEAPTATPTPATSVEPAEGTVSQGFWSWTDSAGVVNGGAGISLPGSSREMVVAIPDGVTVSGFSTMTALGDGTYSVTVKNKWYVGITYTSATGVELTSSNFYVVTLN